MTLYKNNGKAHCPSEGTAESQRPSKIWVGMSARTGDPIKTLVPKTIMAESTNEVTLGDAGRNQISVSGVSGLAPSQVWGAGSGHCGKSSKHLRNFRVGTLNVNTLKGRVCEVVETLSRRKVDLCCVQETRYRCNGQFFPQSVFSPGKEWAGPFFPRGKNWPVSFFPRGKIWLVSFFPTQSVFSPHVIFSEKAWKWYMCHCVVKSN